MQRILTFILLAAFLHTACLAQVSRVAGAVEGNITDATGASLTDSTVAVRNVDTGLARTALADDTGHFRFTELPVGIYDVRVRHAGFADYHISGVTVAIGQTARLTVQLAPEAVTQQLTVTDEPAALDPTQSTVTTNVDTEAVEELPVVSRNYLNFVLLAPGVAASPQGQAGSSQSSLGDSGFNFGGLRARSNTVSIDGLDNNDEYTGASRTELSLEIVREFQVVNNGMSAESGGASGGAINVVTKSGTNTIHGDTFLFWQNGGLNAREPFSDERQKPELRRYRAGFAIGGPIRRDRTFYYTAFEQEHARGQEASDIETGNAEQINSVIAAGGLPGSPDDFRVTSGFFPVSRAETEATGKLTHQLNERHSLMLRYSFTNNREAGDGLGGGLTDSSARLSTFTADHAVVGSLASVLGGSVVNDLRFQVATRRVLTRADRAALDASGNPVVPQVQIAGVADFGHPLTADLHRRENHYEIADGITLSHGTHLLKFGGAVNRVHLDLASAARQSSLFAFGSLADFAAGTPSSVREIIGGQHVDMAVANFGGYVQDHWTPSWARRLTLDLGVRYDVERLPSRFPQDSNNVNPRVGFAYSPDEKLVFRGGYGIFFDRQVLAFLADALRFGGQSGSVVNLNGPAAVNAWRTFPDVAALAARSIYVPDTQLPTPYSQQANFGVQRLISRNMTASATYQFVRGVKLPRTLNTNLLPPVPLDLTNAAALGFSNPTPQELGRAVFAPYPNRVNPAWDAVYQLQDRSSSTYNGVSLQLNRRLANEVEFSAAYTFSKTLDDASDFFEQAPNPYALRSQRAYSAGDQRHRLVVSGLFDLPIGDEEDRPKGVEQKRTVLTTLFGQIEVAPIFTIASGRPVDPLVGFDAEHSGTLPILSRPVAMARNSLRTPTVANLDLRVLKYFRVGPHGKLDLVGELFNAFNRANVAEINPYFGPGVIPVPDFGRPLSALRARQAQFSIDYEF